MSGRNRLVLVCNGNHYVAGQSLEKQETQLRKGCKIRAVTTATCPSSRNKYKECVVIPKGHWWLKIDPKVVKPEVALLEDVHNTHWIGDTLIALLKSEKIIKVHKKCKLYSGCKKVKS